DHGNSWSPKNTSLGISASPLISNGGLLYTGTSGQGVYLSTDQGNTWTARNNGLPSGFPVFDLIAENSSFYVCGTGSIFHSTDNTANWENISLAGTVQATSVIAAGDTIIASFVSQISDGVYRSTNNGVDWILINSTSGLNDTRIRKFAYYKNTIYAASNGDLGSGNVYVSTDHGISWTAAEGLDDQGHNYPYNFLPSDNTMFLATTNGVYKSINSGLSWTNTGCTNAISLAIIGDTLFAGTGYHGIWKRGLSEMTGGSEASEYSTGIAVYPNPASEKIIIELKKYLSMGKPIVSIYNMQGQPLFQQTLQKDRTEFDIRGFEKGVYLVKLTGTNLTEFTKLVKM
ncbi:MAG: T9SS type A sorting domain-containing protein, partial [Bacteroidetes bacterium]|nr:T9SS type A sorting domain-containing protein [Bacteroidota bacterium]